MRDNYHYERGVALTGSPGAYKLESGVEVVHKHDTTAKFAAGTEVIVSWVSSRAYPTARGGKQYVDRDAVEEVGRWNVDSRYVRQYARDSNDLSLLAENFAVRRMSAMGVRAEKSTDFEDERLGVDLWLFLKFKGVWLWVPVDLTLQHGANMRPNGKKYERSFWKGVAAVHVDVIQVQEDSPDFELQIFRGVHKALDNFWCRNKRIFTRHEARRRELLIPQ